MPISAIDLLLRTEKGSRLTITDHDSNLTLIQNAVNSLVTFANTPTDFTVLTGTLQSTQFPSLTGDVTTSGFAATLAATGVSAGSFGGSTAIPVITVDSKGRITGISTASITAGGVATVRASTVTGNITLAGGAPNVLDGVALAANDRIIVRHQTIGSQNGFYSVQTLGTGANGTWVRTSDTITAGMLVSVTEGAVHADCLMHLTTDGAIVVGTTSLSFSTIFKNNIALFNIAGGAGALAAITTGINNTALGYTAGGSVTTGSNNLLLGYGAGSTGTSLTTGSNCTLIGYQSQVDSAAASNRMALGSGAIATLDNGIFLGNSSATGIFLGVSTRKVALWSKTVLTISASLIATDASVSNYFTVAMTANATLSNPTNLVDGQIVKWRLVQDATGGRTLAYGSMFKFPGFVVPTLSVSANAVDVLEGTYDATTNTIMATLNKNFG